MTNTVVPATNINFLTRTQFDGIESPSNNELYMVETPENHGSSIFTENGTFTVPEGVTRVFVYMCGGGGGGVSTGYSYCNGGNGGTSTFGSYAAAPGGEGAYTDNDNSNARRNGNGGASGWATTTGFSYGIGGISGSAEVFAFSEGMWVCSSNHGGGGIGTNFSGGSGGAVAFELGVSPCEQIQITIGAGGAKTEKFNVEGKSGVCFVRY